MLASRLWKRMASSARSSVSVVTVIGAGLMGSGIAQVAAQAGLNVHLVDQSESLLQSAKERIVGSLKRVAKKKFADNGQMSDSYVSESVDKISFTIDGNAAAASSDLVIEAIIEKIEEKQKLFRELDQAAPSQTVFATNTSSLPVSDIANVTKRLDRFGGLHFFNPVPVMKLVEVARIPETSDETFDLLTNFGKTVGKHPVSCKDTPGFVVNRLLVPYQIEAFRMLERGDATAEDIDMAMKLGAGYPMGPFQLADYVGLDTLKFIIDGWHAQFPDNPLFNPCALLDKLVNEGKLGMKSGEGVYKHTK